MVVKAPDKGISVDESFLRKYLEKGGVAHEVESGKQVDRENVDQLLEEDSKPSADQTRNQNRLHERAKRTDVDLETSPREQRKLELEQARAVKEQKEKEAKQRKTAGQVVRNVHEQITENVDPALDRIASLKTVGGIGLLLLILILLLFVVIPVNAAGDTRLKQLWYMVNGRTTLQGRVSIEKGSH